MLQVKSGCFGRVITEDRVRRVAKSGLELATLGKSDESRYMGTLDQIHDFICDRAKETALERISNMSQHTGKLHLELEKPVPQRDLGIIHAELTEIDTNKRLLSELMPGKTLEFGYQDSIPVGESTPLIRPIVSEKSYLIMRDNGKKGPIAATSLYQSAQPAIVDSTTSADSGIPSFIASTAIEQADLAAIVQAGQIKCFGKIYQVRIHMDCEPIVIYSPGDRFAEAIQEKLSSHWISSRSDFALAELVNIETVNSTLPLMQILPAPEDGRLRTQAELAVIEAWTVTLEHAGDNLLRLAQHHGSELAEKKARLSQRLKELADQQIYLDEQKKLFLELIAELAGLRHQKSAVTEKINGIKKMFQKFVDLERTCGSEEIRLLLQQRLIGFNIEFDKYNKSFHAHGEAGKFSEICRHQTDFLRNFDNRQIVQCLNLLHPSPVVISLGSVGTPPRAENERLAFTGLIENPRGTWMAIQEAMQKLEITQRALTDNYVKRQQLALTLREIFRGFKGENGEGLDPLTGQSFYTPETFSCIISLKQIRTKLLDEGYICDDSELQKMCKEIDNYSRRIDLETREIDQHQMYFFSLFRSKIKMYKPDTVTRLGKTVYKTHEHWINDQRHNKLLQTVAQ